MAQSLEINSIYWQSLLQVEQPPRPKMMSPEPQTTSPSSPVEFETVTLRRVPVLTVESSIDDPNDSHTTVRLACCESELHPEMADQTCEEENGSQMPKVHLYIKGSHNLRSVDGSLFCHIIHLYLRAKKTEDNFDLDICLINPNKIPDEIRKDYTGRLPAVCLESADGKEKTWLDDVDEITEIMEERYPEPAMSTPNTDMLITMSSDVMRKFIHLLQTDDRNPLVEELRKFEKYLESREKQTKFLSDDRLKIEDCFMLPKLLQAMIATKILKEFSMPDDFVHVKQYINNAIDAGQFIATRPSQAEIVMRWCTKTQSDVETLAERNESFRQLASQVAMIGTLALRTKKRRAIRSADFTTPEREVHTFAAPSKDVKTKINYSFNNYGGRITQSLPVTATQE